MALIDTQPPLLTELLDFLVGNPTPEEIIALRPSEATQQRMDELIEHNRNGTLSQNERQELEEFLRLDQFVTLLKARARKKLKQQ